MTLKGKQRSSQTDYWHFSLFVCPITLFIHMLFNHRGVTLTGDEKARMHFTLTYFFKNSSSSELHNHSPSLTAVPPPVERRSLWVDKKKKIVVLIYFVFSHYRALAAESFTSSNECFMCFIAPCFFFRLPGYRQKQTLKFFSSSSACLTSSQSRSAEMLISFMLFQGCKIDKHASVFFHFAGLDPIHLHVCDENTPLLMFELPLSLWLLIITASTKSSKVSSSYFSHN